MCTHASGAFKLVGDIPTIIFFKVDSNFVKNVFDIKIVILVVYYNLLIYCYNFMILINLSIDIL